MNTLMQIVLVASAVVVLAEALNKLERAQPMRPGLTPRQRVSEWLKGAAWCLLGLGSGIYAAAALMLGFGDAFLVLCRWAAPMVMCGFAVLIVRTRVKEG